MPSDADHNAEREDRFYFKPFLPLIGLENSSDKSGGQKNLEQHPHCEPRISTFWVEMWPIRSDNASLWALVKPRVLTDVAAAVEKVTSSRMACLSPEKLAVKCIA